MSYFVNSNDRGITTIDQVNKEELLKLLERDDIGRSKYGATGFIQNLIDGKPENWNRNILIIRGEIVTPRP